jgi:nucleotide-binding universal stress UspA family protein
MFPRILIAVDGSDTSERALREAIVLAEEGASRLRIVHALDLVIGEIETPYELSEYEASLRADGERILKRAAQRANKAGVNAETSLLEVLQYGDRVADEIVREAEKWRASLIVIGTHGRRGFRRALMGSVAEGVVRIAGAPVLLIRGKQARAT